MPSIVSSYDLINDQAGYDALARLFEQTLGLRFELTTQNRALFCSRFAQVMNEAGLDSFEKLLQHLHQTQAVRDDLVFKKLIHAATTHTTEFFRDPTHFDFLKVWFRQRISGNGVDFHRNQLRIWCAAVSTGEEALSVLMTLLDLFPELPKQLQLEILATDIDEEVLKNAENGIYRKADVKSLSPDQYEKYFVPIEEIDGSVKNIRMKPRFVDLITFRPYNLTKSPFLPVDELGKFDLVLCRNVLIYFAPAQVEKTLKGLKDTVLKDGVLILGNAEAPFFDDPQWQPLIPSVFARR